MAAAASGMVIDRRMRPHSGPRDRRTGVDRRRRDESVAVDRRDRDDRRTSDRSRSEMWTRRAAVE